MTFWIDAQLPPALAPWLTERFGVAAVSVKFLALRDATDKEIFAKARANSAIVVTKDVDFVSMLEQFGPPPQVLWLTLGNTSNANLKLVLNDTFKQDLSLFLASEALVEISELF